MNLIMILNNGYLGVVVQLQRLLLLIMVSVALFSCNGTKQSEDNSTNKNELKESLFEANKRAIKTEEQQIHDFVLRHKWKVEQTGTGLLYNIYEKGKGEQAAKGKIAVIDYAVRFLNGIEIYSSDELGPKEFIIGRAGVESGLEEGILLLREGDRAKFIIPSHLAHGLVGDGNKIPPKSTLIYDVRLLKLK